MNTKRTKILALFLAVLLLFSLAACGSKTNSKETQAATEAQATQAAATEAKATDTQNAETKATDAADATEASSNSKTLVVFFSATGTTKGVAQMIADATGADTYEILAAQTYTEADLNWNDKNSRTTTEQNDKSVRPEIGSEKLSLDGYSTIYIGYPIWWGEEPRIMDTFAQSYDFTGKTMIPFCTSGGSGIGSSGKNLAEIAGTGNWVEGDRLSADTDIAAWIKGLNLS
ncbi:flavodoxin [Ruminococcus sp.]|uniref:flavodoxin n=1 Tax=Ruminococcus sp. TaxID=41978 RepID=UPI00386C2BC9